MNYNKLFEQVFFENFKPSEIIYKTDVEFSKTRWVQEDDEGEVTGTFQAIVKKDKYYAANFECTFYVTHPGPGRGEASFPDLKDISISSIKSYKTESDAKKDLPKLLHGTCIRKDLNLLKLDFIKLASKEFKKSEGSDVELNI